LKTVVERYGLEVENRPQACCRRKRVSVNHPRRRQE